MQSAVATAISAMIVCAAAGQDRDLFSDLENLNVRHTTAHYALAGTVSDAKLRDNGKALELAYREYATGFGELLDRQVKNRADLAAEPFRAAVGHMGSGVQSSR